MLTPGIMKKPKVEHQEGERALLSGDTSDAEFDDWNLLESFGDGRVKSEIIKNEIKVEEQKEYELGDGEIEVVEAVAPQRELVKDLCEFECHIKNCWYRTRHFSNLLVHQSRQGQGWTAHYKVTGKRGKTIYKEDITRLASKIKFCLCKVCGIPVLHDHTIVQFHIYQAHNQMLLKDYEMLPANKWQRSKFVYQGVELNECKVVITQIKGTEKLRRKILMETTPSFDHMELAKKYFTCQGGHARRSFLPANSLGNDDTTKEVADICIFSCHYCDLKTSNYAHYRCHSCTKKDGKTMMFHSGCEIRYHTCCICSKKIPCSIDAIRIHVCVHEKGKYKDIDKYMALAMEKRQQKKASLTRKPTVPDISHLIKVFKVPFEKSHLIPEKFVSYEVRNLCKFACNMCLFRTSAWTSFFEHVRAQHKEVPKCKEEFVVKARYHACNVCSKRFLNDIRFITQHALITHSMTKLEYEAFCKEVGPVFSHHKADKKLFARCKLCSLSIFLENRFTTFNHMQHSHENVMMKYSKKLRIVNTEAVACVPSVLPHTKSLLNNRSIKVVTSKLKFKLESERLALLRSNVSVVLPPPPGFCSMPKESVSESKTTDIIDNLCVFGCTKCEFKADMWRKFSCHLKKCVKDVKFKTDYLVEARYHRCSICSKPMLCDKDIIRLHASRHKKDEVEGTVYNELERFRVKKILGSRKSSQC